MAKSTQSLVLFLNVYLLHTVADRGVHFLSGLSDTNANVGERAELSCKLSSEDSEGRWYKNGKLVSELPQVVCRFIAMHIAALQ